MAHRANLDITRYRGICIKHVVETHLGPHPSQPLETTEILACELVKRRRRKVEIIDFLVGVC